MEDGFSQEFLKANPYYHSKEKGCRLQYIHKSYNRLLMAFTKKTCLTHKVITGRIGWELGRYGDMDSTEWIRRNKK